MNIKDGGISMKNLVDFRILCLGVLVLTSGCTLDSLGSSQYLDGVGNNGFNGAVTTNTITNDKSSTIVTNVVTNFVTNLVTNNTSGPVVTNVIIPVITNTITNTITNEPVDNRTDLEKFMYAVRGKDIKISDSFGIDSYGSFSADGKQLHTNLRTSVSGVNAHSTAAAVLYTTVTTYDFKAIKDTGGYKATYYGESFELLNVTLYYKRESTVTITFNADRTTGTISSSTITYAMLSGKIADGFPKEATATAKFTIIDR